jgi:hypothetical protein
VLGLCEGQEACAGHSGLGLARAPKAFGRLGGLRSPRRDAAGLERLHSFDGSELERAFLEAVERRLATTDDPAVRAKLEAVLRRRTAANIQAAPAQQVRERAAAERRAKEDEERAFVTRVGGGSYEAGLEEIERIRREGEERRRQKEREDDRARRIAEAEEKLRQRDRRLAWAIRRGESVADL